jgi:hypothetical protein
MYGDVVPIGEFLGDAAVARRIVFLEIVQRRVAGPPPIIAIFIYRLRNRLSG